MKLDPKVKGALAWAGLVVILAVPSAEMLTGKPAGQRAASMTSDLQPVRAASATDPIETAGIESGTAADPVEAFVKRNGTLPSYISDGAAPAPAPGLATVESPKAPARMPAKIGSPVAVKPTTTGRQPVAVKPLVVPTEVASATPAEPPVPLPRSMRPKVTAVAALPKEEPPLIIDEGARPQRQATLRPVEPFPLSDSDRVITSDELEEWDSGSLADYLARKGMLNEDVVVREETARSYDEDGFFLDERPRQRRIVRPDDDWDFPIF